ncbi:IclR family transcriptional regulator [Microvirga sp. 2MCAF38]|uniref:IclR family transcriptional regulator n=1 Tax=Microvirga sp. 2MCAF38 TaxID=3232989 RepID=UPI003F95AEF8
MSGTQSIRRTVLVLKSLADRNQSGAGMSEVAAATDLEPSTAHRILKALAEAGLVLQQRSNRRYFLGPVIYDLGLTAAPRFDFQDLYKPVTARIAEQTGDTVFFSKRSGLDMVCLDRATGSFPIKAFVTDVGLRRPIGVGAGSLAILASLREVEAQSIIDNNADLYEDHDKTAEKVLSEVSDARRRGYVVREIPRLGVTTLSAAVHDRNRQPFASISVASITPRMNQEHQSIVIGLIKSEVIQLERRLSERDAMIYSYAAK